MDPFSDALSRSIERSGMTLEQIASALAEAGTPVSMATLSYWRSGRAAPRRAGSRKAVEQLEQLLGTGPGRLVSLLDPSPSTSWDPQALLPSVAEARAMLARHGLDLDRHWNPQYFTDITTLSADRRDATRHLRRHLLAERDEASALSMTVPVPSGASVEVSTTGSCRLLDRVVAPRQGRSELLVLALELAQVVEQGQMALADLTLHIRSSEPMDRVVHGAAASVRYLVQGVAFQGEAPTHVRAVQRDHWKGARRDERHVAVYRGEVQLVTRDMPSGLSELRW